MYFALFGNVFPNPSYFLGGTTTLPKKSRKCEYKWVKISMSHKYWEKTKISLRIEMGLFCCTREFRSFFSKKLELLRATSSYCSLPLQTFHFAEGTVRSTGKSGRKTVFYKRLYAQILFNQPFYYWMHAAQIQITTGQMRFFRAY